MTLPRMIVLLVVLALTGVGVVALRVEQSRHMRRIQELQFTQTELRQKIWTQEIEQARLRSPQMIRERAERLGIQPPAEAEKSKSSKKPTAAAARH